MRNSLAIAAVLGWAAAASAETALDCAALVGVIRDFTGYALAQTPTAGDSGVCELANARLTALGRPDLTFGRVTMEGATDGDMPTRVAFEFRDLRLAPTPGRDDIPDWLRESLRLQSADLAVRLIHDPAADRLEVRSGRLALSGGSILTFDATLAGAELSGTSALTGLLTDLTLTWKNDGRILRPAMEAAGGRSADAATGTRAVDAVRATLEPVIAALPAASVTDETRRALEQLVRDLPQGRGKLVLTLASPEGIGVVAVGFVAMADDPTGPDALGRLLQGTTVSADWQPGLAP